MRPDDLALYVVTDPALCLGRDLAAIADQVFSAGVAILQLRDKGATTRALIEQACRLKALALQHGGRLLVNDRVDVAFAAGADGVHLGQDDLPIADARRILGPGAIIGVSVQTAEEAHQAEEAGADYLAANLVFPTPTKTDCARSIGLAGVRLLRDACGLPLVAIGGIHAGNAADVVAAGADGVAVVSAVMAAPDAAAACRALLQAVSEGRRRRHG